MRCYDGVYLNLLPVCECGEILRDAYTCESIGQVESGYKISSVEINPVCCPFCGQTVRGFMVRNEYLRMFGE